jgi:mevalonate kinase
MNTDFRLKANGKLLISGEYLVLNGAKALAFPINFGQEIIVKATSTSILNWKSTENNKVWFTASFELNDLKILKTTDMQIALELKKILQSAILLNPDFICSANGYDVSINADYPLKWGLGSSSTLIYLIAVWAKINEFSLFKKVAVGSGYDIACASEQSPIFYQLIDNLPHITPAEFGLGIKNHCLFAYLGNKQSSNAEIEKYKQNQKPTQTQIKRVSELADEFSKADNAADLIEIMNEHEQILSSILKQPMLAHQSFPSFKGAVKSLGAWGGDFALFASHKSPEDLSEELKQYGITSIFSYKDLLIKK